MTDKMPYSAPTTTNPLVEAMMKRRQRHPGPGQWMVDDPPMSVQPVPESVTKQNVAPVAGVPAQVPTGIPEDYAAQLARKRAMQNSY